MKWRPIVLKWRPTVLFCNQKTANAHLDYVLVLLSQIPQKQEHDTCTYTLLGATKAFLTNTLTMPPHFKCQYCGRVCKTLRGLKQHIAQTKNCLDLQRREVTTSKSMEYLAEQEAISKRKEAPIIEEARRSKRLRRAAKKHADSAEIGTAMNIPDHPDLEPDDTDNDPPIVNPDGNDSDSTGYGIDTDDESIESLTKEEEEDSKPSAINTSMLNKFRSYCDTHSYHFLRLTKEEKTCIKLLDSLKRKKAPLNAYPDLLEWHLKETKQLREGESLKDTDKYFHRKTLMKHLMKRYNMEGLLPKQKQITLPFSKATVSIPYCDAADCIVSLLTDPRFKVHDYLFFMVIR